MIAQGLIAQTVERAPEEGEVVGAIPAQATRLDSSAVEHSPVKRAVEGSIPSQDYF